MKLEIDRAKGYAKSSMQLYKRATSGLRLLPDFLIIGAQRCGTTSLYNYLLEHPGVVSASTKEIHFFDYSYDKGLNWYRAQFPSGAYKRYIENKYKQPFLTGEATVNYLFHPLAPRRIAAAMPAVRLIVLLRNPIDRAYSQHWLESKWGHETLPFAEVIKLEEQRLAGEQEKTIADEHYHSYSFRHYSYLARGIYVDQLQRWLEYYPREQFLILRSEDLYADPASAVQQTLNFIGASTRAQGDEVKEYRQYREPHKKGYKNNEKPPKLDSEVRKSLIEYFKPHNARLYELLGRDFGWDQ